MAEFGGGSFETPEEEAARLRRENEERQAAQTYQKDTKEEKVDDDVATNLAKQLEEMKKQKGN